MLQKFTQHEKRRFWLADCLIICDGSPLAKLERIRLCIVLGVILCVESEFLLKILHSWCSGDLSAKKSKKKLEKIEKFLLLMLFLDEYSSEKAGGSRGDAVFSVESDSVVRSLIARTHKKIRGIDWGGPKIKKKSKIQSLMPPFATRWSPEAQEVRTSTTNGADSDSEVCRSTAASDGEVECSQQSGSYCQYQINIHTWSWRKTMKLVQYLVIHLVTCTYSINNK